LEILRKLISKRIRKKRYDIAIKKRIRKEMLYRTIAIVQQQNKIRGKRCSKNTISQLYKELKRSLFNKHCNKQDENWCSKEHKWIQAKALEKRCFKNTILQLCKELKWSLFNKQDENRCSKKHKWSQVFFKYACNL